MQDRAIRKFVVAANKIGDSLPFLALKDWRAHNFQRELASEFAERQVRSHGNLLAAIPSFDHQHVPECQERSNTRERPAASECRTSGLESTFPTGFPQTVDHVRIIFGPHPCGAFPYVAVSPRGRQKRKELRQGFLGFLRSTKLSKRFGEMTITIRISRICSDRSFGCIRGCLVFPTKIMRQGYLA